ncbi:MAG: ATPase [Methylobacterium mesophilicum]|nr:ATPase [Methylobacterium mesophilicum]
MDRVLGLDGGGSKTLLAVANRDGTVTRLDRSIGLDPLTYPDWQNRLRELLRGARDGCGPIAAAVTGLPVHGEIARITAEQDAIAQEIFGSTGKADNDVRVAFDGALGGKGGVLLLSGTGSMAWASAGGDGAAHIRVGGWSEAFGDEGSAFWVGREALSETTRVLDKRSEATAFASAILAAAGTTGEGLLTWAYGLENRRAGFAALSRAVSELALNGNATALAIMGRAADELAEHAQTAWRLTHSARPLVWACAGGTFQSPVLRRMVAERLGSEPEPLRLPPVGGAVLRAARLAGWTVDEGWIERLAASLGAHPALAS